MKLCFDNIRETNQGHCAIVCRNIDEITHVIDVLSNSVPFDISDVPNDAENDRFCRGLGAAVHISLDSLGNPKWEGWCDEGWYAGAGIPEIEYKLLLQGDLQEEPIQAYTQEEFENLWEGI